MAAGVSDPAPIIHGRPTGTQAEWTIRLAWVTIGLATLVGMFDGAVNVAFPAITKGFSIAIRDIQWIITIYVLAQSCLNITFGKLADRYGYREVFMVGLAISAIALFLCSIASQYPSLVGYRFAQGIGVGLIMATAPAMASFLMSPDRRREAMGYYTMWLGLGQSLGPLMGGYLVSNAGWPGVFAMRVPVAILALILVWRLAFMGSSQQLNPAAPRPDRQPPDIAGAAWLALALGSLVFFMVQWHQPAWGLLPVISAPFIFALSLIMFWRTERTASDPIVDVALFRNAHFRNLQIAAIVTNFAAFSIFLVAPYLFIQWPGFTVIEVGLLLSLYPIGMLLAGLLSARLSALMPANKLVVLGMATLTAGLLGCAAFSASLWLPGMIAAMLVSGLGHGTFQVGHLDATLAAMPVADRGVAGSIVNVARLLGIVLAANSLLLLHESLTNTDKAPEISFATTFAFAAGAMGLYCVLFRVRQRANADLA